MATRLCNGYSGRNRRPKCHRKTTTLFDAVVTELENCDNSNVIDKEEKIQIKKKKIFHSSPDAVMANEANGCNLSDEEQKYHRKRKEIFHRINCVIYKYTSWIGSMKESSCKRKRTTIANEGYRVLEEQLKREISQEVSDMREFLDVLEDCSDYSEMDELYHRFITTTMADKEKRIEDLKKHFNHVDWKEDKETSQDSWNSLGEHLCSLLGLNTDWLKEFDHEDYKEVLEYSLPEELILSYLDNTFRKLESEDKYELSTRILNELGFTTDQATRLVNAVPLEFRDHLTTIDWVKIFIENQFKHNVLLMGDNLCQDHFKDDPFSKWFHPTEEQCSEMPSCRRDVNVIKLYGKTEENRRGMKDESYIIQDERNFPGYLEEENHRVLFHGTGHDGAISIMETGILLSACERHTEFCRKGEGFFLSDTLQMALKWGRRVGDKPAVLVYRIANERLETFDKLDLTGTENKRKWKEVCGYYLTGGRKKHDQPDSGDFIEGPMVKKTSSAKNKFKNIDLYRCQGQEYDQICIKSISLADEFNACLHSVLFFY